MAGESPPYVDTSALAKWYLNEPRSAEFEAWVTSFSAVRISALTVVEMRSLLARRRRMGELEAVLESRVFATFLEDIRQGFLLREPLQDRHAAGALNLMASLPDIPLRTLDAFHLAIARDAGSDTLATADRVMASAAERCDLRVVRFG